MLPPQVRFRSARRPGRLVLALLIGLLLVAWHLPPVRASDSPPRIMGFTAGRSAWERQWEAAYQAVPDASTARSLTEAMSSHPSMYGTAWDRQNLAFSVGKLRSYGLDPQVVTYYPYTSYPGSVTLEMVAPERRPLKIIENGWPWQEHWQDVPIGFNAYSPAGDVTAEIVYANYGRAADYARLAELGVDVRGKIVLVRSGGDMSRGGKHAVARRNGAAGVILYPDPAADGCTQGAVYPAGPYRPPDGIERGSLMYIWEYPGDPLTPGWAATADAGRLAVDQAYNLPQDIPATPIGYGEAGSLLRGLGGPVAPDDWQGGLARNSPACSALGLPSMTYHLGPGPIKVHLTVQPDMRIRPIDDLIVQIPGRVHPEQMVLLGSHRDGWVYGARDPMSGWVTVMEMARGLALLLQQGWRPDRTIVLAGWGAEEPFELGSVEWVEQFEQALRANAVAYVNLDSAGGGKDFYAFSVPALDDFIYGLAKDVEDPARPGHPIYEAWAERLGSPPAVWRHGGGSDYSAFLEFVGVPIIDITFYSPGEQYHSAYDDLYSAANWGDRDYVHRAAAARLAGLAAMRLAGADILPFRYSAYASAVTTYIDGLADLQKRLYGQQVVGFERERVQAQQWQAQAAALESGTEGLLAAYEGMPLRLASQVDGINGKLVQMERTLTQPAGVPGRPWFRHMIYGTDVDGGYAAEYLPALTDAITAGDWPTARRYQDLLYESLRAATATATLEAGRMTRVRAELDGDENNILGTPARHPWWHPAPV